jgi:HTH-type transcriptional regulator / antitoxin HigA
MIATVPEKYTIKDIGVPKIITSEKQYDLYAETLFQLESQSRLTLEEESYAKILMNFIAEYDEAHHPIRKASPVEILRTLMDANNLRQKDLAPIFGSESVVSEILGKKRDLNKSHIQKLSKRFSVSPAIFF